jgi:hypothetical protein
MKHCKRGALRFRGYRIKRLPESDESEEKGLVKSIEEKGLVKSIEEKGLVKSIEEKGLVKSIEEEDRKVRSRKLVLKSGGLTP